MNIIKKIYGSSLTLLTDLYEITMAYAYWKSGMAEREAVFHLFFRKEPFNGGYTISAGLELVIEFLKDFRFHDSDIAYLKTLKGNDGKPLFEKDFLDFLKNLDFSCTIDAIPEGTVVFPNEPLLRVQGPLLQAQLIESVLLNIINFQTLIATKSARICLSARAPVMEFGLRRAQGIDGALAASRAAYIGGCSATSNVLAGKIFDIPVSGTHAHSWVMSFDSEIEAFRKYAEVMSNNCILLVDTYDTRQGIAHAIEVGKLLRENGKKLIGVRIDSGDLAYFSQLAREMLDNAGFYDTKIVASNDLDEHILESLHDQNAKLDLLGVGTKLVTAYDQPALGGVYKLSAIKNEKGEWESKLKLSEQTVKINIPGIQQVRRFYQNGSMVADMIYDTLLGVRKPPLLIDPNDQTKRKKICEDGCRWEDLLVPVFKNGKSVYNPPSLNEIREVVQKNLKQLHPGIKRLINPHVYVVGLESRLNDKRMRLILEQRKLLT